MSKQPYFEHDNRGASTSRFRSQPSYTMGRQRKFRNGKSRMLDFDGDVDMMEDKRRFNPYSNNGGRRYNNKQQSGRAHRSKLPEDDRELWFRITIPYGKKMGKDFILKEICSHCSDAFIPINFQFNGNVAEFYVQSKRAVNQLKDLNGRVTTPDGFKMRIVSTRCNVPVAIIDSETQKIIEECMSSRYDPITHVLNLSNFHHDERLKSLGYHIPLIKPKVINVVMGIITKRIPELEALDLSNNHLYSLESLKPLVPVCKQLKSLVLRKNKLKSMGELNYIKGLELISLVLDQNPLCDYKNEAEYTSAVRERFPKLLTLDNQELPPPIKFDLGPETCPVSKKCFFAESEGPTHKELVIQFLDQYYTIYDSGDRTRLLDAYHEQATFSLSLSKSTSSSKTNGGSLSSYTQENRNLLKVSDSVSRLKLLKQGKLSIVTALSEMPQTQHDPSSFSVDIFHLSPALMSFSVIGVFKEVGAEINNAILKTFSRTFVVAPHSAGIAIINETLFISHASQDQQLKAFKGPAPTPSPSPAPSNEEKSPSEKQLMVIELSKQTGMNLDFSTKCLEENDWDYQKSLAVFMKFQSEGKIPPQAFVTL